MGPFAVVDTHSEVVFGAGRTRERACKEAQKLLADVAAVELGRMRKEAPLKRAMKVRLVLVRCDELVLRRWREDGMAHASVPSSSDGVAHYHGHDQDGGGS